MAGRRSRTRAAGAPLLTMIALIILAFQAPEAAQNQRGVDQSLMYMRGQSVLPMYMGWVKQADGSFDLHFGYINRNWQEELDIPAGPDNNVSAPFGPDAGQPTHLLPGVNRWQFAVRVPPDFGTREVVWTVTANGDTNRAYGTLKNGYTQDALGMQREFQADPPNGNQWPTVRVEGETTRTARVGQPFTLTALVADDGLPKPAPSPTRRERGFLPGLETVGMVGSQTNVRSAIGLRFAWYLHRTAAEGTAPRGIDSRKWVTFDPPQFETWEDFRTGRDSPWAPGWITPPVPPDGRYVTQVTFHQPGTFVLRGLTHDGFAWASELVTVTVTP